MYKVSVIIPVYNMEQYLSVCLDTIIAQTIFSELEIVCINDGSTDASLNILNTYADTHDNFIIIDQENSGVGIARNNGINRATGEFIAFMDPDDYYLENNSLERLYNAAVRNNVLICGGSLSEDHNDGKWIRKTFEGIYQKYTFTEEQLIEYKDYQFDFGFYRFIYNREFLVENDIFFPPYIRFQDPPFFVKAMITAGRFYAIPDYTYCYRYGHQNLIWHEERVCALINGHIDNLKMSAQAGLGELHALTLHRLVNISRDCIAQGLATGSNKVLELLNQAEQAVEPGILPADCSTNSVRQFYFEYCRESQERKAELEEMKAKCERLQRDLKRAQEQKHKLEQSTTYKVGSKILYFPKKIRKIIKK